MEYITSRIEPKHTLADNTQVTALLDWLPTVSLSDGIAMLKKDWNIN